MMLDNQKLSDWINERRIDLSHIVYLTDVDRSYKEGALSILYELEVKNE